MLSNVLCVRRVKSCFGRNTNKQKQKKKVCKLYDAEALKICLERTRNRARYKITPISFFRTSVWWKQKHALQASFCVWIYGLIRFYENIRPAMEMSR
jgi:hypothetical protein